MLKSYKSPDKIGLRKKPTSLSPQTEHIEEVSVEMGRISNISAKSNKRTIYID